MATPFESHTFATLIDRGVLQIGDGHRAKLSELGGDGPIFLRAGLLADDGIRLQGADRFRKDVAVPSAKFTRGRDTFVTTKGNSVGRTGYVPPDLPQLVYSPHLSYWRSLNRDTLHPEFLRYWARSPVFVSQLHAMAHGTDMAPYLSLIDQKRLVIPLPSIQEQQSIARVLGALDDKIDSNRRLAGLLEETAAALVENSQLTNSVLVSAGEVAVFHNRRRVALSAEERRKRPGEFRYYGATGVVGHIDGFLFSGPHVLVGEDGSVQTGEGRPVLQYVWDDFWVNNHAHVLTFVDASPALGYLVLRRANVAPFVTGPCNPSFRCGA